MMFLFSVNVYLFIPMVLFYNQKFLKIVKNGYTWAWVRFFCLGVREFIRKSSKIHCFSYYINDLNDTVTFIKLMFFAQILAIGNMEYNAPS